MEGSGQIYWWRRRMRRLQTGTGQGACSAPRPPAARTIRPLATTVAPAFALVTTAAPRLRLMMRSLHRRPRHPWKPGPVSPSLRWTLDPGLLRRLGQARHPLDPPARQHIVRGARRINRRTPSRVSILHAAPRVGGSLFYMKSTHTKRLGRAQALGSSSSLLPSSHRFRRMSVLVSSMSGHRACHP